MVSSGMSHPNILLFHCHDLGQHLGCYGQATVSSPNLDRLAAQGVLFRHSYCTAPQCSPSRASLFTGRYPQQNGVMGLTHHPFDWDLHPGEQHLAQLLRDQGYRTSAIGIIHECARPILECGFESYSGEIFATQTVDATIARLRRHVADGDGPWYIQAGTFEPHRVKLAGQLREGFLTGEFQADTSKGVGVPAYLVDDEGGRLETAELQGAIRHLDEQVGRLLVALETLGLAENTLFLFVTDHGVAMPRAKCSLYEPGIEVATILRLPSRSGWHGGRRVDEMISNVDVLPTLLALIGAPIPGHVAGRSFAPLLDGGTYEPRTEVFTSKTWHDYYDPMRSVRVGRYKLHLMFSTAPNPMNPTQSWRPLTITRVPADPMFSYHDTIELYDLDADPLEHCNLAMDSALAAVRSDLLARLYGHMRDIRDPLLTSNTTDPSHHRAMALLTST